MRVQYDITTKCNLSCEICYIDGEEGSITAEKIAADLKTHPSDAVINIGGGEPFQHPELEEIIRNVLGHGNKIQIATNATDVPDWFYLLPEKDKVVVQASLLAATREKYVEICGKDCFEDAISNIKKISESYSVFINTPLYKGNIEEVQGLIRLSQSLDIPIHFSLVIPKGRAKNVQLLDRDDIERLRSFLYPYIAVFDISANFMTEVTHCPILALHYPLIYSGNCNHNSLYIGPNNEVRKCVFGGV